MMKESWRNSVVVERPVEQVYAYLADFPKHVEWSQTLERQELKEQGDANGVGAVWITHERQAFHNDRKPFEPIKRGFRARTLCRVQELVPQKRIAWRSNPVPIGMGVHSEWAFDLEPAGPDRTRLTQSVAFYQPALLIAIMRRLARLTPETSAAQWNASLENIKQVLEGHAQAPETVPSAVPAATSGRPA
jgi:uncharacterized membrane protein